MVRSPFGDICSKLAMVQGHEPITYYTGPIGTPRDWLVWQLAAGLHAAVPHPDAGPREPSAAFQTVYILRNSFTDSAIYIGKTTNIANRLEQHRRRDWWQFVDEVELNLVACIHRGDCADLERATLLLENMAIGNLRPLANKYVPQSYLGV